MIKPSTAFTKHELINQQAIMNLISSMLTCSNPMIFLGDTKRISIFHKLENGLLRTYWTIWQHEIVGNTLTTKTFETHCANDESLFEFLWNNRASIQTTCSIFGWDDDEQRFLEFSEYH